MTILFLPFYQEIYKMIFFDAFILSVFSCNILFLVVIPISTANEP